MNEIRNTTVNSTAVTFLKILCKLCLGILIISLISTYLFGNDHDLEKSNYMYIHIIAQNELKNGKIVQFQIRVVRVFAPFKNIFPRKSILAFDVNNSAMSQNCIIIFYFRPLFRYVCVYILRK